MIEGVSWVGIRTAEFLEESRFFEEVLQLRRVSSAVDFVTFKCPNGDAVELFGPRSTYPSYQFASSPIVVGFSIGDIDHGRRKLQGAGVELLGNPESDPDYGSWQHFRGPGGFVYELNSPKDMGR